MNSFFQQEPYYGGRLLPGMYRKGAVRFAESDLLSMVAIPVVDAAALTSFVILPGADRLAEDLVQELDSDMFFDHVGRLRQRDIELRLPCFEFNASSANDACLRLMGIEPLFKVNSVLVKTVFKMNELGAAAAATTCMVGLENVMARQLEFNAHGRSFIIIVANETTREIVMVGMIDKSASS